MNKTIKTLLDAITGKALREFERFKDDQDAFWKSHKKADEYANDVHRQILEYLKDMETISEQKSERALKRLAAIYGLTNERGKQCDTRS